MNVSSKSIRYVCLSFVWGLCQTAILHAVEKLSFNLDVRPILAGSCYDCHGPDEEGRKAKLRLDDPKSAAEVLKADGEFIARITSQDPDDIMPPPESHRKLKPEHIALLKRWVEEGAKYEKHWAFVPPKKMALPKTQHKNWTHNPIDTYILARLEKENLSPSAEADRLTLIRRASLDLTGLLPSPEAADAFVKDQDPNAYEKLIDRLLASKDYGERWARPWLDLARYADSNGYEKDRGRSIWPYRDWVIHALNNDMPYDQFSIEQLAGDMLKNSTAKQKIATGFHRNTMLNEEGGIDPLEYRFYSMVDRVATTGTVWMGLTLGCAQCHTHKYDPITHVDYYRFMALMNNANEPYMDVETEHIEKVRKKLDQQITAIENDALKKIEPKQFQTWLKKEKQSSVTWKPLVPVKATSNLPLLTIEKDGSVYASGDFSKRDVYTLDFELKDSQQITAIRLSALPDKRLPAHGPGVAYYEGRNGDFFLSEVKASLNNKVQSFSNGSVSYSQIYIGSGKPGGNVVFDGISSSGWSTAKREGERHHLVLNFKEPVQGPGQFAIELLFERHFVAALGKLRFDYTDQEGKHLAKAGDMPDFNNASKDSLQRYFIKTHQSFKEEQKQIKDIQKKIPRFHTTLVMSERVKHNPRKTFRHHRGEYLKKEEEVTPALPSIFSQLSKEESNRLGMAKWLVSQNNPLVARVSVNRAWQEFFGQGLVITPDDFGTQSEPPSHPELLDWLAIDFMEKGWSMKQLHKRIVMSATYKQQSSVTDELLGKDPSNKLLARGPRFRVPAEIVRDSILSASGLLHKQIGGRSVFPPQPASVTAGKMGWKASQSHARYRRSLYTFSKRTAPFAAFTTFDAPTGESCVAKRQRSNTPLQSLTLLNSTMFMEMAQALAQSNLKNGGDLKSIATSIFRRCLIREPSTQEINSLITYYTSQLKRFENGKLDSKSLLNLKNKQNDLAAWTLVARVILNTDEMITKQ